MAKELTNAILLDYISEPNSYSGGHFRRALVEDSDTYEFSRPGTNCPEVHLYCTSLTVLYKIKKRFIKEVYNPNYCRFKLSSDIVSFSYISFIV